MLAEITVICVFSTVTIVLVGAFISKAIARRGQCIENSIKEGLRVLEDSIIPALEEYWSR